MRDEGGCSHAPFRVASAHVYDVRAEVPGELHVMPTEVTAMYSPSLFGYSAEKRLTVR